MGRSNRVLLNHLSLLNLILKGDHRSIQNYTTSSRFHNKNFQQFIKTHHLGGYLYPHITKKYHLSDLFPDSLTAECKALYERQWHCSEKILHEAASLSADFLQSQKEIIFLKGPFLSDRYYGNIDQRSTSDIDILVKRQDIDAIGALLIQAGYQRFSRLFLNKNATLLCTHHFEYHKPSFPLDLHWNITNHFSCKINYQRLWDTKEVHTINNKSFLMLSVEYELLFQILSVAMNIQAGMILFKHFLDIYMILKSISTSYSWDEFFFRREEERTFVPSLNILDMVLSLFDARDEFPRLCFYIAQNSKHLKYRDLNEKLRIFHYSQFAFKNKLWALKLYEASSFNSILWWALSLPFRLSVYQTLDRKSQQMT